VKFVLGLLGNKMVRVALVVLVVILGWMGVKKGIALFHSVNSASFTTPSVSLTLDTPTGNEEYSALNLTSLAPGANIYMGLTITNSGSSGFRYGMVTTSSGDETLDKDLRIGVAAVSSGCNPGVYSAGTRLYSDRPGLDRAAFAARSLPSGSNDYLCFHLQLPLKLPGSLAFKSAAATFDFTAEQT
jgi:hypothetical protein